MSLVTSKEAAQILGMTLVRVRQLIKDLSREVPRSVLTFLAFFNKCGFTRHRKSTVMLQLRDLSTAFQAGKGDEGRGVEAGSIFAPYPAFVVARQSAAIRTVRDAHLAEDVAQGAFVALARNAGQLTDRPALSGWLHRTAQNIAGKAVRTDVRRRAHEKEAVAMNELLATESDARWEQIAPHVDSALGELSEPDRDALLLRVLAAGSESVFTPSGRTPRSNPSF